VSDFDEVAIGVALAGLVALACAGGYHLVFEDDCNAQACTAEAVPDAGQPDAGQPAVTVSYPGGDFRILRDDERGVTCWGQGARSLVCRSDSELR